VVPENVIQAETVTLSEELAGAFVANNGERACNFGRLGVQVARLEVVARSSSSNGRHERTDSRIQAARQ